MEADDPLQAEGTPRTGGVLRGTGIVPRLRPIGHTLPLALTTPDHTLPLALTALYHTLLLALTALDHTLPLALTALDPTLLEQGGTLGVLGRPVSCAEDVLPARRDQVGMMLRRTATHTRGSTRHGSRHPGRSWRNHKHNKVAGWRVGAWGLLTPPRLLYPRTVRFQPPLHRLVWNTDCP